MKKRHKRKKTTSAKRRYEALYVWVFFPLIYAIFHGNSHAENDSLPICFEIKCRMNEWIWLWFHIAFFYDKWLVWMKTVTHKINQRIRKNIYTIFFIFGYEFLIIYNSVDVIILSNLMFRFHCELKIWKKREKNTEFSSQ